jgi:hypothetical protein
MRASVVVDTLIHCDGSSCHCAGAGFRVVRGLPLYKSSDGRHHQSRKSTLSQGSLPWDEAWEITVISVTFQYYRNVAILHYSTCRSSSHRSVIEPMGDLYCLQCAVIRPPLNQVPSWATPKLRNDKMTLLVLLLHLRDSDGTRSCL